MAILESQLIFLLRGAGVSEFFTHLSRFGTLFGDKRVEFRQHLNPGAGCRSKMENVVPIMTPATGSRLRRFVGDTVRFELRTNAKAVAVRGWRAVLRTNVGRAEVLRREILLAHTTGLAAAGESWRDLPVTPVGAHPAVSHSGDAPSHSTTGHHAS